MPEKSKDEVVDGVIDFFNKTGEPAFKDLDGNVGLGIERKKEVEAINAIKGVYPRIVDVLKKYCDLDERYYSIIALWIIGTYLHDNFLSYPYLYFNAIKSSGKTRILNLIACLSKNGMLLVNMSEAVLFRTAHGRTLCIDEFEGIGSKDKNALRELLNAAYKKGIFVERAKKVKNDFGDSWRIERFNVYTSVAMANIWGMDDVLGDRCISLPLEKSSNQKITRLMEIFSIDPDILSIKRTFSVVSVVYRGLENTTQVWNDYILTKLTTLTTLTTYYTNYTNYTNLFKKIEETSLDSRNLELFFPLFLIADYCGVLDDTIKIAEDITSLKKSEDVVESRDVALLDFISRQDISKDFVPVKGMTREFREFMEEEGEWLNTKWFGKAMKRLGLILEKRRVNRGMEIRVNFSKAREKIKMFREVGEGPPSKPEKKDWFQEEKPYE